MASCIGFYRSDPGLLGRWRKLCSYRGQHWSYDDRCFASEAARSWAEAPWSPSLLYRVILAASKLRLVAKNLTGIGMRSVSGLVIGYGRTVAFQVPHGGCRMK